MEVFQSKTSKTLVTIIIVMGISWAHSILETEDNPLSRQVDRVVKCVEVEDWAQARVEVERLREQFDDKRRVLELFGPVEHVSVTKYNIISLVETVDGENATEAKQLLAKIKSRFNEFIVF